MTDYDIEGAFRAIENELLDSMVRNLKHHRAEETKEGFEWTSWQAEQLNALSKYKKNNKKRFRREFAEINQKIEDGIRQSKQQGKMDEEVSILEAIKQGFKASRANNAIQGEFFKLNERKLNALINATTSDIKKAETAMLRMAEDQYRKVIFNAQVYANTGAGTYEQAVDMATKDFLSRGINCIEYKNGARVNIASYAAMAIRTANTRAYFQGEGEKRQEWGISTVIMNKRGNPCLKCLKWAGKVLIDDVWSGGKATDGPYPLMSTAMAQGLYHPNCKDGHTTFFPGISEEPKPLSRKDVEKAKELYGKEQKISYAQRQAERFKRLSDYSLDEENQRKYGNKAKEWAERRFRLAYLKTDGDMFKIPKQKAFEDVTEDYLKGAKPGYPLVVETKEYVDKKGNVYKVDGINVKQNNTPRELEVAEILSKKLKVEVQLIPEINGKYSHVPTSDYLINGERWDLKELKNGTSNELLRNIAHKKKGQAECLIFDITNSKLDENEINRQAECLFDTYFNTKHIESVILIRNSDIVRILKKV